MTSSSHPTAQPEYPAELHILGKGSVYFQEVEGLDLSAKAGAFSFRLPGGASGSQITLARGLFVQNEALQQFLEAENQEPQIMEVRLYPPKTAHIRMWTLHGAFLSQARLLVEGEPLAGEVAELVVSYAYLEENQEV